MSVKRNFDIILIGGGHNGLVCACYLAKAGLKVCVLERRHIVGGAAVTEEFAPRFRNSVASYTVSLLQRKIIEELQLSRHGLRIVERHVNNFIPSEDGRFLAMGGLADTHDNISKYSRRDAEAYRNYNEKIDSVAEILRNQILRTPPNLWSPSRWRHNLLPFLDLAGSAMQNHAPFLLLKELLTRSAGAYLDEWFETPVLKALLGFDSIVGHFASPYSRGSAYVLLHHVFGEVNGKLGLWGHALGGMGAITQAMAKAAQELGVTIHTQTEVAEVMTNEKQHVSGVLTSKAEHFSANHVVSNLNPKLLFTRLVDPALLPSSFKTRMENWRCGSGTFRMNVALSELPQFKCLPEIGLTPYHTAGIIISPNLDYMHQAYLDASTKGWSSRPIIELLIPSTLDDSLAPQGQHVASLFCQHVAPELPNGDSWDLHKYKVADLIINTVNEWAPNFRSSVIALQALSPLDLEREFGLSGGDIFHGVLSADQLFWSRPAKGYGDYRTPIKGLYQCGSGTHPGGGVTGAPGYNAAREIIADFKNVQ
jgi:phytoene dehydrogenase-like protein